MQRNVYHAVLALLAVTLLTVGCGKGAVSPSGTGTAPQKSGTAPVRGSKPYTIKGKTYRPLASAENFREEGTASWYGKDFHGRPTASGEIYDMYGVSAAHKLLPLGTRLRVTNLENGKQVEVTVNDRGPFVRNRVLDVSYGAAKELGMVQSGLARVRIVSLGGIPRGPDGGLPGPFFIQVGSFTVRANAEKLASKLKGEGYRGTRVVSADVSGKTYYRVQAGEFQAQTTAGLELERLRGRFKRAFLVAGG